MKITSHAIRVAASYAETFRKILIQTNMLRTDLRISKDSKHVYLPVKREVWNENQKNIEIPYELVEYDFEQQSEKIYQYKEIIDIPKYLIDRLPSSFDRIGSIILIKLDEELQPYEKKIGAALLQAHTHIDSIYRINPVQGELRTRSMVCIAGTDNTKTIHKEYGLSIHVDVDKVYFTPRLATERRYIASLVKPDEIILDMFTGVAPFPLIISRFSKPKHIIAVDKNLTAIELARKNIVLNKINTSIELYHDDAVNIPDIIRSNNLFPDRIIMNLPFHAHTFFLTALECVEKKTIIHFYTIGSKDLIYELLDQIKVNAKDKGIDISIGNKRVIKSYSPHEFYMGIDITAKKIS